MELDPKTGNIIAIIPKGIKTDLDRYLVFNPPNFGVKFHKSNFYYILSKIFIIAKSKKFKNLDKIPISSTILMHEIGRHYKKYVNYLIMGGFIETDNHYIVGNSNKVGKCKCYGLSNKYKSIEKYEKCQIDSKSVIGHFLKWKNEAFSKVSSDEMLSHLYDMVQKFTIDDVAARKYLENMKGKDPDITDEWIESELDKCRRINDKSSPEKLMYMIRDPYDRIHTNITSITKHIRENFLLLENEPVKSIDMVSSQASLLYLMMKKHFESIKEKQNKENEKINAFNAYFSTSIQSFVDVRDRYVNKNNSFTGEPIYYPPVVDDTNDIDLLGHKTINDTLTHGIYELAKMEHTLKNGLYEFFMSKWNIQHQNPVTRDEIKKKWIKYVFGKVEHGDRRIRHIWDTEFPTLSRLLDWFKRDDYRKLAHKLQKTEANLVFNKVCKTIDTELGIKYATVHDSIIVKKEHVASVTRIFNRILSENGIVTGAR